MGSKETDYFKNWNRCGRESHPSHTYKWAAEIIFYNAYDDVPKGSDLIVLGWSYFSKLSKGWEKLNK